MVENYVAYSDKKRYLRIRKKYKFYNFMELSLGVINEGMGVIEVDETLSTTTSIITHVFSKVVSNNRTNYDIENEINRQIAASKELGFASKPLSNMNTILGISSTKLN